MCRTTTVAGTFLLTCAEHCNILLYLPEGSSVRKVRTSTCLRVLPYLPELETNFLLSSTLGYRGVGCQGNGVMLDFYPTSVAERWGHLLSSTPPKSSCKATTKRGGSSATCYPNLMSKNYECGIKLRMSPVFLCVVVHVGGNS